jgi:hypothetical protein
MGLLVAVAGRAIAGLTATWQRFTMREAAMHQQINKIDVVRVPRSRARCDL